MRLIYEALAIIFFYMMIVSSCHYLGGIPWSPAAPFLLIKVYKLSWPTNLLIAFLGAFGVTALILLLNPFKLEKIHGESHLASEKEIKDMGLRAEDGLILGKKRGRFLRMDKPLSVLVFAPPGTGKTAAEIVPSLLASTSSTITYDVKGELLDKTGPWRSQFSKVLKFAPGEEDSARWNPLSKEELPSTWEDKEVHLGRIAECLFPVKSEDDSTNHWVIEARRIFIFWGLYLILQGGDEGETSFREILSFALNDDPQNKIQKCLLEPGLPERIEMEGNALVGKAEREFSGVLSSFANGMNIFMDPRVSNNTKHSEIRLSDLRRERISIYLVVSDQDSARLKPILTLFLQLAANAAMAKEPQKDAQDNLLPVNDMGEPQLPITFFMDEFVRLGKMDEVKRIPALGRSYYLNCVFVVQTLAQLQDIYGPNGANEIIGTCSFQVFFTQNDANAEFSAKLSKAIGNKTVRTKSKSGRFMEAKSSSIGETGIPLFRIEDINSLPFGQVIILAQNHFKRPILAKAPFWFKDSNLRRCARFKAKDFAPIPTHEIEEAELILNETDLTASASHEIGGE